MPRSTLDGVKNVQFLLIDTSFAPLTFYYSYFKHIISAHGKKEFNKLIKNLPEEERPSEEYQDKLMKEVIRDRLDKQKCLWCKAERFPVKSLMFDHIISDHSSVVDSLLDIVSNTDKVKIVKMEVYQP